MSQMKTVSFLVTSLSWKILLPPGIESLSSNPLPFTLLAEVSEAEVKRIFKFEARLQRPVSQSDRFTPRRKTFIAFLAECWEGPRLALHAVK
jgi:hypothetical protein